MQLVLQIQNPGEWAKLLAFLQQQGISFQLTGRKSNGKLTARQTEIRQNLEESLKWAEAHARGEVSGPDAYELLAELTAIQNGQSLQPA